MKKLTRLPSLNKFYREKNASEGEKAHTVPSARIYSGRIAQEGNGQVNVWINSISKDEAQQIMSLRHNTEYSEQF